MSFPKMHDVKGGGGKEEGLRICPFVRDAMEALLRLEGDAKCGHSRRDEAVGEKRKQELVIPMEGQRAAMLWAESHV
jgi:hypothetical protein